MTLKEAELDNLKKATKKTVTSSSTSIVSI